MRLTLKIWRQPDAAAAGAHAHLRARRRLRGHVVPRDARRAQRAAQRRGRGADRVRLRLPRGHLRHVRPDDQRRGARPRGHHHLPAAHAVVQRRRRRSPSSRGAPTRSRCSRTSSSTARAFDRIIQAGGYISVNTGAAPDAHATPGAEGQGRPGLRRRHLHRLRRLRRGLPQRLGLAVRRRQDHPPRRAARRARPSATAAWSTWSPSTTTRASAAAPTSASAPPPAPRRSRST